MDEFERPTAACADDLDRYSADRTPRPRVAGRSRVKAHGAGPVAVQIPIRGLYELSWRLRRSPGSRSGHPQGFEVGLELVWTPTPFGPAAHGFPDRGCPRQSSCSPGRLPYGSGGSPQQPSFKQPVSETDLSHTAGLGIQI